MIIYNTVTVIIFDWLEFTELPYELTFHFQNQVVPKRNTHVRAHVRHLTTVELLMSVLILLTSMRSSNSDKSGTNSQSPKAYQTLVVSLITE